MADIPHFWRTYARLQAELNSSQRITNKNWGIEAAMNRLLDDGPGAANVDDKQITTSQETGCRRERDRKVLRDINLATAATSNNPDAMLEARQNLAAIKATITASEWGLLCDVGHGYEYAEIATRHETTSCCLRVKVSRLRQKIRLVIEQPEQ